MKLIIILVLLSFISCASQKKIDAPWKFRKNCSAPESVYFDSQSGFIFVSNIVGDGVGKDGVGHISKLDSNGNVIDAKWIKGLNAPKGMRSQNGKLWVTDIDRVIVIDIKKKKIIKKIKIKGAKFLNDIAISPKGIVFVSDTLTSKIHLIKKYRASVFLKGAKLESPNGLLYKDEMLYVSSWGLTTDWSTKILGRLYSVDIKSKKISYITKKPLGNLDGLEIDKAGDFLVSDWVSGKVIKISKTGAITEVYKGKKGLADIGYISETNTILVPQMLDNTVLAVPLI